MGQVLKNVVQPPERAATTKDERLKALNAIKAGSHIHELSKNVKAVEEGNLSVANVNIGIGTSESETVIESSTVTAHESTVAAEKDVNITATGKDINIIGSDVTGENVNLNAKENINIEAKEQSNVTNTESKNSSAFAGVSIGIKTGTIGVNVSGSAGKDTIDENSTSYKASSVTAKEKLEIESGKDTNLIGSKAEGEKVEANVGGDLNIESLQETNKYREESVNGGFGINTLLGENISRDISVSANYGKTNSDYKSVTEQAGIYAGKEGFDIKVENNTDLKGAVIASEAEADKNTLTTGTISFSDIKNEAEYDTKGIGMTLDANKTSGNQPSTVGQKGLIPTVPASVGDSAESTTKSGVSEGKINITKPEKQKQDVNTLNRDTKNTLNKLDKIFDLEKIREDQETAALFGELAANGIHVLAEKNKWKNDDPEKIALHAAVGAVVASITKGNIASGALAGGATEYLANEIIKACKGDKAQAQWVAAIIGAALSKSTGGDAQQGAFVAVNAIRNNYFWEHIAEFRRSLKEVDLSGLEPWECRIKAANVSIGFATGSDIAVIFNTEEKDVFSAWSVGAGIGVLPAGLSEGRAHLEDRYGRIITDREEIIKAMEGGSITMEGALLFSYSESRSKSGYRLVVEGVQSNASFSWTYGETKYLGEMEDVAK